MNIVDLTSALDRTGEKRISLQYNIDSDELMLKEDNELIATFYNTQLTSINLNSFIHNSEAVLNIIKEIEELDIEHQEMILNIHHTKQE
jgi:hypothetical protein